MATIFVIIVTSIIQGLLLGVFFYYVVKFMVERIPDTYSHEYLFRREIKSFQETYPEVPFGDEEECRRIGQQSFYHGVPYWYGDFRIIETVWWKEGWVEARSEYYGIKGDFVSFLSPCSFDNYGDVPPKDMWDVDKQRLLNVLAGKKAKYYV